MTILYAAHKDYGQQLTCYAGRIDWVVKLRRIDPVTAVCSRYLPTFERAHLDAILQTRAWRIENE